MADTEAIYFAGFFDGEGCVAIDLAAIRLRTLKRGAA